MRPDKNTAGLTCPECGNTLKEVYVEANYGRALLLDQCHRCGGIWFDTWELYYLNDAEAKRLDAVDMNIFLADNPAQKGSGLCPRCNNISLESFQDPNLPSDSRIDRCPRCNGLWLNKGELVKYAEHKSKVRSKSGIPGIQKDIHGILALNSLRKERDMVKRFSAALRTRPVEGVSALESEEIKWDGAQLTKDALFLILQILFRMVFKI